MKRFLSNNIFTNPKGWAMKAVGSVLRYRLMQVLSLILGVCLAGIFFLICREAQLPLFGYLCVLVFLIIAVVQLPLFYLRALRCFVIESQLTNSLHSTPQ
jgi:hypothetical protein